MFSYFILNILTSSSVTALLETLPCSCTWILLVAHFSCMTRWDFGICWDLRDLGLVGNSSICNWSQRTEEDEVSFGARTRWDLPVLFWIDIFVIKRWNILQLATLSYRDTDEHVNFDTVDNGVYKDRCNIFSKTMPIEMQQSMSRLWLELGASSHLKLYQLSKIL